MFDCGYFLGLREPVFSDIVLAFVIGWIIIVIVSVTIFKIFRSITEPTFEKIWKIKMGEKNDNITTTEKARPQTMSVRRADS